mgnify:CR=1 FL=1
MWIVSPPICLGGGFVRILRKFIKMLNAKKIALNVVKSMDFNGNSIDIKANWVFVETDKNDRSDCCYGNIEHAWSSYGEFAWMNYVSVKSYTGKRSYGENKGSWLDHDYNLGAGFNHSRLSALEDTCKKLKSFETKLGKHAEKYGSADSFAEFLFRLAIVSKCDFILTEKRVESSYNYRANLVDGDGKQYLKAICELPKMETVVVETE